MIDEDVLLVDMPPNGAGLQVFLSNVIDKNMGSL